MMMNTSSSSSSSVVPSDNRNTSVALSTVNQSSGLPQALPTGELSSASRGPVAILWDIENCPIPSDVRPEDVAGNIRMTLRVHPVIKGAVTLFSAYGDFNAFPRRLREGCQRTGVKLIDVPNGRKDAADKAILVDMFLFALDNPPPSSIMLISGDVDFAPALHILGQRGYTVILVIPAGVGVSSALCNAGRYVWDWPSVARGEGFLPPRSVMSSGGPDFASYMPGGHLAGCGLEPQNEEESIVYKGTSQTEYSSHSNTNQVYSFNSTKISRGEFSGLSHSLSEYSNRVISSPCFPNPKCQNFPSGIYNADERNRKGYHSWWVQPGDIQGLKAQLVKLLELSRGSIPLLRLPPEYHKMFGRQLYVVEYGESKLVNLLSKMGDVLTVEGKGHKRCVCLCNFANRHKKMGVSMVKKDKRERNGEEERSKCIDISCEVNASSDDEKVKEFHDVKAESSESPSSETEESLDTFRFELQELLVSHNCKILLYNFEALYEQRYKRTLDLRSFGVDDLEELLEKVRDVVVLHEDEEGQRRFVIAR